MKKNIKAFSKKLFKNERGQGATEYILLLVVVVAIVLIFKEKIKSAVTDQISNLSSQMQSVSQ